MDGERLYTLDAMRGIAAVLVVLYHAGQFGLRIAPGGYLAVDFFFALSGLVLARAYAGPFAAGLGFRTFMGKRYLRLYPMFAIGLGFAVVKAMGQIAAGDPDALTALQVAEALATEAFMLPSPVTGADLYPLNGVSWSLFFELLINMALVGFLLRVQRGWLVGLALVAAGAVAAAALTSETLNVGWSWKTAWAGLARVAYAFTIGVLFHRFQVARARHTGWLALVPVLALIAALTLRVGAETRPLTDIAIALVASPLLLALGASLRPARAFQPACVVLGDLSYPLYAIHFPLLFIVGWVAGRFGLAPLMWVPPFVVGASALAFALGRWIDPFLRQRMALRRSHPAAPPV